MFVSKDSMACLLKDCGVWSSSSLSSGNEAVDTKSSGIVSSSESIETVLPLETKSRGGPLRKRSRMKLMKKENMVRKENDYKL